MHFSLKSLFATSAFGLAALLPAAHGQLTLSGSSFGTFLDPTHANTVVTNGTPVSLFESGIPWRASDNATSIQFTGDTFTDVGNGERLDLGRIDITNGMTLLGSTATSAAMDLYLNLPENGIADFKLTTLMFAVDNTANHGDAVPDLFLIGHSRANTLIIDGRAVTFDLRVTTPSFMTSPGSAIAEGSAAAEELYAYVHFTPVPEPSTYALWGTGLLAGLVALRRFRGLRNAPTAA